jgi:monoamine oxidase
MASIMAWTHFINFLCIISIANGNQIYDVVIIGAGPSGIAAAIDLIKSGRNLSVTILEARDRIGGRVITDKYTFENGVTADVGAEWIHAYQSRNSLYDLHRHLQSTDEKKEEKFFDLFGLAVTGCHDTSGLNISRSVCEGAQKTMKKLFSPKYNSILDDRDLSVREMIRPEYEKLPVGQLKRLIDAMIVAREEYSAADLEWISARQEFFGDSPGDDEEEKGEDMALKRGFGTLIERIAKLYAVPVQLNMIVNMINTSDANRVQITTKQGQVIRSRVVLVTVPLGCLKHHTITFMPSLPSWKVDAINTMGFGDTDKIILQFDRVFWNSSLTSFYIGGSSFPFAICAPAKRILVFMIGGTRARKMEANSDNVTVATIMQHLHLAFPHEHFKLRRHVISRWSQDPYARGSYAYYALNTSLKTFDTLAASCFHNRVFWAGEHTSSGGSVHTAFATGQREATKMLAVL